MYANLASKILALVQAPTLKARVDRANEPYRMLVDIGREAGVHTIVDGTDEYSDLVDELESQAVAVSEHDQDQPALK